MAFAHVNFFEQLGRGTDTDAPVFDGTCSQARVDIPTVPGSLPAVQATVGGTTKFAQVVTDGKLKVFCGPAAATTTEKNEQAFIMAAGTIAFSVQAGQALHIWTA